MAGGRHDDRPEGLAIGDSGAAPFAGDHDHIPVELEGHGFGMMTILPARSKSSQARS